jgi:uncharacterized membrane protein YeaQ/YmgE (transglycosylase-associated protein family)
MKSFFASALSLLFVAFVGSLVGVLGAKIVGFEASEWSLAPIILLAASSLTGTVFYLISLMLTPQNTDFGFSIMRAVWIGLVGSMVGGIVTRIFLQS